MLFVLIVPILKQESVSLATTKTFVRPVIPESVLVREESLMTPTRVETRQHIRQIMVTNTSEPWDIFWFSDKNGFKLRNCCG